jgi:hypothetical protein
MATSKTTEHLARNFTVVSVQKKVFARSNFGFILVNKEYLNKPTGSDLYNRVLGFDYNLASKNNFWAGKLFYHRSFQPNSPDKQYSQGATINYKTKNIQIELSQTSVGENYNAESGFVRRTGYNFLGPEISYLFVPNKWIVSHGITLTNENFFNPEYKKIEHENTISYQFQFQDRSAFMFGYRDYLVQLQEDFDPTHSSNVSLPAGSSYNFNGIFATYESTRKTLLNWQAETATGSFYNGNISYIQGQVNYRYQPYLNLSVNFNYTDIRLPQPFKESKFWLFGPKLDLTFTDKIFLSTFVQYNEQIDNMNINMRFQWRYQPVSDIHLVYTDNYIPG